MNVKPPRVFVTQEISISYIKAEKYGEIVFLTGKEPAQNSGSLRNIEIFREMRDRLAGYRPGIDYLLPCGSPLAIGLAIHFAIAHGPYIKILHWQRRDDDYLEYTVDLSPLGP